jgi:hypothetical protein
MFSTIKTYEYSNISSVRGFTLCVKKACSFNLRHKLNNSPQFVVVLEVKAEHLVEVFTGQLSLGIQGDVALLIDGVAFHSLLAGNAIEALQFAVPVREKDAERTIG